MILMTYYRIPEDEMEATPKSVAKHLELYKDATGASPHACFMLEFKILPKAVQLAFSTIDFGDDEEDTAAWLKEVGRYAASASLEEADIGFILFAPMGGLENLSQLDVQVFPNSNAEMKAAGEFLAANPVSGFSPGKECTLEDNLPVQLDKVKLLPANRQYNWLALPSEVPEVQEVVTQTIKRKRPVSKATGDAGARKVPQASEVEVAPLPRKKIARKTPVKN